MVLVPLGKIAIAALPKIGKTAGAILAGGKIPGGIFGQKAFEYGLVLPALGAVAGTLGLPFGYKPPQSQQQQVTNLGLTPQQFEYLYGRPNYQLGPFELPFGRQEGLLERQAREQRALQRELGLGYQATQRYGIDATRAIQEQGFRTQERLAQLTTGSQRDISKLMADTQRALGFAGFATQYAMADLGSRRQLAGLYGGYQRDVAIADRQLAGLYDTNRAQSRIASIASNTQRYLADRGIENTRLTSISPRLAAIGNIFTRRF